MATVHKHQKIPFISNEFATLRYLVNQAKEGYKDTYVNLIKIGAGEALLFS